MPLKWWLHAILASIVGASGRKQFDVLLTGFGPFLDFAENPTTKIAQTLSGTCDVVDIFPEPDERSPNDVDFETSTTVEVCWHAHVLPVSRIGALWTVQHLRSFERGRQPYDAIFHTGLEDNAKGLKLEVAGANIQANDDGSTSTQQAVPGGSELLPTTVNTGWMSRKNLVISGPPPRARKSKEIELWSRDAGTYYCNEVYYRTLEYVRSHPLVASSGALLPVMFIHVQSPEASSVHSDVDSVRQIAAHALWATYLATYLAPAVPQQLHNLQGLPQHHALAWSIAPMCCMVACLLVGCAVARLRAKLTVHESGVPLLSEHPRD